MKHCPKCRSSRIRRGYALDLLVVRMFGFRELLCDSCNLRFRAFVLPGTLPKSGRHKKQNAPGTPPKLNPSAEGARAHRLRGENKSCPQCSSDRTHRSHRRGVIENIASLGKVYPYRCDECHKRFLARRKDVAREVPDPQQMRNILLNVLVVVVILGLSWLITNGFARAMYIHCVGCGTLNARRRTNCRNCSRILRDENDHA